MAESERYNKKQKNRESDGKKKHTEKKEAEKKPSIGKNKLLGIPQTEPLTSIKRP